MKVMLIVMDSVGIGALPDAKEYGDEGSNTLGNIASQVGLNVPNLTKLGLGKIAPLQGIAADVKALGAYGKMAELSKGKDTTTGHWEIAGIITEDPMPTFAHSFPATFIKEFEKRIQRKTLGNVVASGTEILKELGEKHMETGFPIVYTSADSVFQIAAHEEVIPLEELYEICKIAREMLTGDLAVGRVIARPFIGKPGNFTRTTNRHDYSLVPPRPTVLDALQNKGYEVISIGKIKDIFAGKGITKSITTKDNKEGVEKTIEAWSELKEGLIFTNLVEFDSLYGHRNNPKGYAEKLAELDGQLPDLMNLVEEEGILILTADHGNDPTTPSTDHSREYVPLLVYGKDIKDDRALGTRHTFADIAATLCEIFSLEYECVGESFWGSILKEA